MENEQLHRRLALASQSPQNIECQNLQNGRCTARRFCASVLAGTQGNTDRLVQHGRKIAEDIVQNGTTFESPEGNCLASSQEEAQRCNGFIPVLLPPNPSTRIDV